MPWSLSHIRRSRGAAPRIVLGCVFALLAAVPGLCLAPSTTTLTLIPSAPVAGQVVTFIATAQSGATNISPGVVTFYDGGLMLTQAQLISGSASTKTILGIGSHNLRVVFSPTTIYSGSSSAVQSITVSGAGNYKSATAISSSGTVGNYTLTGTVTDFGRTAAGGTVSFIDSTDGGLVVGEQTLDPASLAYTASEQSPVPFAGEPGLGGSASPSATDFNGDGIKDIALPMANGSKFNLFLGNATGTFQAPITIATAGPVTALTTGDWNGDGKPDIAVAYDSPCCSTPAVIEFFLGNGDGTFTNSGTTLNAFPPNTPITQIVSADVDNDGRQDLVVDCGNVGYVFKATGSVTFSNLIGSIPVGYQMAVGDLNADGFLDVVGVNATTTTGLSVFLNNGTGAFSSAVNYSTASTPNGADYLQYLTLGDFNGDGRLDVAASNNANHAYVALGNGDGTFASFGSFNFATPFATISMSSADLDGDGNVDVLLVSSRIALPSSPGVLGVLYGKGDGTFKAPTTIGSFDSPNFAVIGDFNGDSIPDFAMTSTNTHVTPFTSSLFTLLGAQSETASVSSIAVHYGGPNSVYAEYSGDAARAASQSSSITLQGVNNTATSVTGLPLTPQYGSPLTLTATVTSPSGQIPTGTVTFSSNGAQIGSATVIAASASGVATLTTSTLAGGPNNITASYGGDPQNSPSSGALQMSVATASTSIALTSSANPAPYRQPVTFTATVAAGVTGTVTFLDGALVLGTSSITGTAATLTASSLGGGTHSITAQYNGDSNHSAGSSNMVAQVIQPVSVLITITSSENPSKYRDSVSLSFAVAGAGAGAGAVPTGSLSIVEQGENLGIIPLDASGRASLSFSNLPAGSHGLICTYNGDSNYY